MNKAFIDKQAILAVDVSYHNEQAVAAGMLFSDWRACEATDKIVAYISNIQAYRNSCTFGGIAVYGLLPTAWSSPE